MLEDKINQDLKAALLGGDKVLVMTLRGLKSSLLYAKIASNSRDKLMPDEVLISVLQKEAKKRQESAELYRQGGNNERADAELQEKTVIEIKRLVDEAINDVGGAKKATLGMIIGHVKQSAGGAADGGVIARIVKETLSQ
jgi:uncharacterized protein